MAEACESEALEFSVKASHQCISSPKQSLWKALSLLVKAQAYVRRPEDVNVLLGVLSFARQRLYKDEVAARAELRLAAAAAAAAQSNSLMRRLVNCLSFGSKAAQTHPEGELDANSNSASIGSRSFSERFLSSSSNSKMTPVLSPMAIKLNSFEAQLQARFSSSDISSGAGGLGGGGSSISDSAGGGSKPTTATGKAEVVSPFEGSTSSIAEAGGWRAPFLDEYSKVRRRNFINKSDETRVTSGKNMWKSLKSRTLSTLRPAAAATAAAAAVAAAAAAAADVEADN